MKDRFCLVPYKDIIIDKTYTNIGEYFLRNNRAAELLLRSAGVSLESCSDFELLLAFWENCKETTVFKTFSKIVNKLIDEENISSLSAEELWTRTSDALLDDKNKLRATIASSGLESVGVAVAFEEEFDAHFARCGSVRISPVLCPFGTDSVSLDTINIVKDIVEIKKLFDKNISRYDSVALFFGSFSFEVPNEYSASRAYDKYKLGQPLSYKETDILKSQLLRMCIFAASESQKEIMMFLPYAPEVRAMGEVAALLDYIDECNIKANITLFAGDAVSACMAQSIAGERHKNITAATGLCGNGSSIPEIAAFCDRKASLSKTAAGFIGE